MSSQPERLNDRLDGLQPSSDPELEALAEQAQHIKEAPPLQVDADFARRLERRVLARSAELHRQSAWQRWRLARSVRVPVQRSLASVALLCVLLLLILGTGVMAVAHGAGPSSPLYALKNWEQRVEYSLNDPAVAQARLDDQAARDHLSMLANLTDAAHAGAYRDTLKAFNQYLAAFTQDVQALPASNDKDQLQQELVALKSDARHTLRGLLQRLALTEQISTCATLLDLGETMPYLTSVTALLTGHGKVQVTISGEYLQPGARLVVDNQLMTVTGVLQRGKYVFTLNWSGKQQPTLLGIRNPDGTVALSSHFTWKGAPGGSAGNQGGGGNGNGNGNGHGNGNGGGGGKPQDGE